MKRQTKKLGFTLIELLVVVSIISLLSSIVLSSLSSARSKARDTQRIQDIRQLRNALELYRSAHNDYPQTSGWQLINSSSVLQILVTEGFIGKLPIDPQSTAGSVQNNYVYGSPIWWDQSGSLCLGSPYQIQFYLENRDDRMGICNPTNTGCPFIEGNKYRYNICMK